MGPRLKTATKRRFGTNNVAELRSAIDAFKATQKGSLVKIITDSDYLRLGATQWSTGWVENNWKTAKGKPVKNRDWWIELLALVKTRTVIFERIAGHSGDPMNDHVVALARAAAEDCENWQMSNA